MGAPAINCVFDLLCAVNVTDTTAPIPIPAGGTNFLQSRTFVGLPGAPADGLYAYEYRIDLRNALGITYIPCISSMTIEFGPVVDILDYNGDGVTGDQVYVVTSGGLGSIGIASAEKSDNKIAFTFSEVTIQRSVAAHKSGAPFDKLRVTLHDALRVCHGELVESMTAKLHPSLKGYNVLTYFYFLLDILNGKFRSCFLHNLIFP